MDGKASVYCGTNQLGRLLEAVRQLEADNPESRVSLTARVHTVPIDRPVMGTRPGVWGPEGRRQPSTQKRAYEEAKRLLARYGWQPRQVLQQGPYGRTSRRCPRGGVLGR